MRHSAHIIEIPINYTLGIHSTITSFHFPLNFLIHSFFLSSATTTDLVMKSEKGHSQAKRKAVIKHNSCKGQHSGLAGTDDIINLLKEQNLEWK